MKKILVVDDIEENRYLMKKLLEGNNYIVEIASNGIEALEKARKNLPNMIITDSLMPNMDGFQLCRNVKSDKKLKDIIVVFYSATYTDKKSQKLALDVGAVEYICKPQEPDVFIKIIGEIFDSRKIENVDKKPIKETVFMKMYNEQLINKLEKKMLDLEKSEKHIKHLNSIIDAVRKVNQIIVKEKNRNDILKNSCNVIIKLKDYNSVFIGYSKDSEKIDKLVTSVKGGKYAKFADEIIKGNYPFCIEKIITNNESFIIVNGSQDCKNCHLKDLHKEKESVVLRITHLDKFYGFIGIAHEENIYLEEEEKSLLVEMAEDVGFAFYNIEVDERLEKQNRDFAQMIKELNCLYEIYNLSEIPDISIDEMMTETVEIVSAVCKHLDKNPVRIKYKGKEFKTKKFEKKIFKFRSDIIINNKNEGFMEIYYSEKQRENDKLLILNEENKFIDIIAQRLSEMIEKKQFEIELKQAYEKLKDVMDGTIHTISDIVEAKDAYTAGHQARVSELAVRIAQKTGFSKKKVEGIRVAALIHDIGKISIPIEILNKPNKLSEIEYSLIKNHSQIGYDILKHIDFPWPVSKIVLQHHERENGTGYPNKLESDEIMVEAKIVAIADVVEAMHSHRPYRMALGIDLALEEIMKNKGVLYDEEIADICIKIFKEDGFEFSERI